MQKLKNKILSIATQIIFLSACSHNPTIDQVLQHSEVANEDSSYAYWTNGYIQKKIDFSSKLPRELIFDDTYIVGFIHKKVNISVERIFAALRASQIGIQLDKECLIFFPESELAKNITLGASNAWVISPNSIYKQGPMEINLDRQVQGRPNLPHTIIYVVFPKVCTSASNKSPYFHIDHLLSELDKKEGRLYLHFNKIFYTKTANSYLTKAGNDVLNGTPLRSLLTIGKVEFKLVGNSLIVENINPSNNNYPTDLKVGDRILSCSIFNKSKTIKSIDDMRTCVPLYTERDVNPEAPFKDSYYLNVTNDGINTRQVILFDE